MIIILKEVVPIKLHKGLNKQFFNVANKYLLEYGTDRYDRNKLYDGIYYNILILRVLFCNDLDSSNYVLELMKYICVLRYKWKYIYFYFRFVLYVKI